MSEQPTTDTQVEVVPEEPVITKYRVTMSTPSGFTATDYVRDDFLDAYVEDAKTRWEKVEVSDEPDAGPGGYYGPTYVPETLDHPLAGEFFEVTTPETTTPEEG